MHNTIKNLVVVAILAFIACLVANSAEARTIVLTNANTVSLRLPITTETASYVQHQLQKKAEKLGYFDSLYLFLDSPGGVVRDGEKIIETANGLKRQVNTITSFSASMSFIISQYLGHRYILAQGTLMSHRPYGGEEGQIPGSLTTRVASDLRKFRAINAHVASRAGVSVAAYEKAIADELWLNGEDAVKSGFMDEVVSVRCDDSLRGADEPVSVNVMGMFTAKVVFDKCPLITAPLSISSDSSNLDVVKAFINGLIHRRNELVNRFLGGE